MSHLISRTSGLESAPVLSQLNKQIQEPSFARLGSSQQINIEHPAEKNMLRLMFFHYKNAEYEQLHRENAIHLQKQFQELKGKLARRAKREQNRDYVFRTLQKKIEGKEKGSQARLDELINRHPQKVDLIKKYRDKIKGKLYLYREMEAISQSKASYHEWQDRNNNSPLKSPIYSKMTYLLEKTGKEDSPHKQEKERGKQNRGHQRQSYRTNNNVIVQMPKIREYRYSTPKVSKTEFSLYI